MEEIEHQNVEISETIKRKRGRPRKTDVSITPVSSSDETSTNSTETTVNMMKKPERKREKLSEEEIKERNRIRSKEYHAKNNKVLNEKYRKTYVNDFYPLTKLENGKFQCNVCKSFISSARDYYIHEKTKRHMACFELMEK